MEFGELKDVPLREAWPHEANDFTPWLADNLHRLSQAIGVDLELEGTEVSVEGFSADILARIPSDNSMVVIENQLENTDHTHLGQVLTYLAGLEAQTVIWIARGFQGPHLSAIRWLNTHTVDPFAFFAVKVRAVQIGDAPAPVAPLFEVLERPNDWDRRVKGAVDTSGNRRRAEFIPLRREFWSFYAERYQADNIPPDHSAHTVEHKIGGVIVYQALSQDGVNVHISRDHPNYDLMLRSLKELEFIESMANGLEIESGSQGKVVHSMLQPESFQPKSRIDGHETVVALGALRPGRRLGKGGIGLERLMKGLHFPPFLVDRADGLSIAVQIA